MKYPIYISLILLLLLISFAALMSGAVTLSVSQVWGGLMGTADETTVIIVRELRLPRILLALLIGSSLGLSGAALQGLLRNPLADPGILGVSAASSLGAILAIYYGFASVFIYALPIAAMSFALAATFILLVLSRRDASVLTLILAGVAISSLAGALASLAMSFAPTPLSLQDMVMWMLGSLENRSMNDVTLVLPFMVGGFLLILPTGRGLSALALGSDVATSLGINLKALRMRIVIGTAMMVGAGVAVAGMIGFIGLIVPHMVRPFVGYDPRQSLLPSALTGAGVLLIADMIARMPQLMSELRLGVLTAMIGAPVFLYIVFKTRENMR